MTRVKGNNATSGGKAKLEYRGVCKECGKDINVEIESTKKFERRFVRCGKATEFEDGVVTEHCREINWLELRKSEPC